MQSYLPRFADRTIARLASSFPAVIVLGPRGCGKTTTAQRLSSARVSLDDPRQAAPFEFDPSAALSALRPASGSLLIDEWQEVPSVLGAVKRAVDAGAGPGSFLLTGSVNAALEGAIWAGTGRTVHLDMYPLTEAERLGRGEMITRPPDLILDEPRGARSDADLGDYLRSALAGGFPATFGLDNGDRQLWLRSFADQLMTRDAPDAGPIRDGAALRRLLRVSAEYSGAIVDEAEMARAVGIDVRTVRRYQGLLTDLRVVDVLPAWHSSRISRLVKSPKRYLVDSGLTASLLGVDLAGVLRRGDLIGTLLETFVIAQLRSLLAADGDWRLHHLRVQDGRREIDVVAEAADGSIVAIEIKATSAPAPNDGRHLAWLRDTLGERFRTGIVFHTGTLALPLGDRITARPISTLWTI
jgi:predicted AAA+ superfamily ATPase